MRRLLAGFAISLVLTAAAVAAISIAVRTLHWIVPPWYLLPFYSVVRAMPDKVAGIVCGVVALLALFMLPWLWVHRPRAAFSGAWGLGALALFIAAVAVLAMTGAQEAAAPVIAGLESPVVLDEHLNSQLWLSRVAVACYFAYALVMAPLLALRSRTSAVRVATSAVFE